jgi:nitrite reductase/ring-hydroxylating ferredoxin subunit
VPKFPDPRPDPITLTSLADGPQVGDVLCHLDDIEDGKAKTFTFKKGTWRFEVFVQRQGDAIYAYENTCPHVGLPLNLRENRFLDIEGASIFCINHAAYFNIDDGLCTRGPCRGKWLIPIALALKGNQVVVA